MNNVNDINDDIRNTLSAGEQVLWWGQPRRGVILRGADALQIPFSLLWCGFAVFWEWSVVRAPHSPGFFMLWGIPFVAVGIYLVIGRFFAEALMRSRTYYAVTPQRIIIVSGLFSKKVKSLNLKTLTDLSLSEGRSGQGTITFGGQHPAAPMFSSMAGWPGSEQFLGPRFDLIPQAKTVYETIRRAQQEL